MRTKNMETTHPLTFSIGDIVTTYDDNLHWKVTDILPPNYQFNFVRYECQRYYNRELATLLFQAKNLILVKKGDPK